MDVERALVSRALKTQAFSEVHKREIQAHHFLQRQSGDKSEVPLCGEVFAWMMAHERRYGVAPSVELTRSIFPLFEFIEVPDPLDVVLDQFLRYVARREMILAARQLATKVDEFARWEADFDPSTFVFDVAGSFARSIPNTEVLRYSDSLDRLALHRQRQAEPDKLPGLSTGVARIDDLTYGIQDSDLAIIEGFLGLGKSSLAVMICAIAYFEQGKTPFYKTLEADGDKLIARWDAYAMGVQYRALKRLELGEGDLAKWEKMGELAANSKFERDVLVDDRDYRPSSDNIFSDVQRWRPDLTIIDPIDEMSAPAHFKKGYEQIAEAAKGLKSVARRTKTPVVAIAQAGREAEEHGATLGNVADSIMIPRKADIVIGLHATPQMKKMNQVEFRTLKIRDDEGEGEKISMHWDRGRMKLRPWTPADAIATRA
jgi:replicative DNA helicase